MDKNHNAVKFLHFRRKENGKVASHGGITIAFQETTDGQVRYATAQCSHLDNFCKARGRDLSRGRLGTALAPLINVEPRDFPQYAEMLADEFGFTRHYSSKRARSQAAARD